MQIIDKMSTSSVIHVELTEEGKAALAGREQEVIDLAKEYMAFARPRASYTVEITPYGFMFMEDDSGRNPPQYGGLRYMDVREAMKLVKGRLGI